VDDVPVASYVVEPALDIRLGPRPYLHPVRTLGGVTVTDVFPFDHPWHLGASLAMPYVNGFNLWGGRSCLPERGYTWRDDHGRIVHVDGDPDGGERLRWEDRDGGLLLTENRRVTASAAPLGWSLSFDYDLSAPDGVDVVLGSPATSGYPGAGGYGGFFWRAGPGEARAFTASGADQVQGSAEPWMALTVGAAYTLVFTGLAGADRWFVRTAAGDYAGVCAALAYERPLTIAASSTLSRRIRVLIADGELTSAQISGASAAD
jgi:hypothetical protein